MLRTQHRSSIDRATVARSITYICMSVDSTHIEGSHKNGNASHVTAWHLNMNHTTVRQTWTDIQTHAGAYECTKEHIEDRSSVQAGRSRSNLASASYGQSADRTYTANGRLRKSGIGGAWVVHVQRLVHVVVRVFSASRFHKLTRIIDTNSLGWFASESRCLVVFRMQSMHFHIVLLSQLHHGVPCSYAQPRSSAAVSALEPATSV